MQPNDYSENIFLHNSSVSPIWGSHNEAFAEQVGSHPLVLAYPLKRSTHDQPDPLLFMKCYGFAKIKVLISALPISK